MLVTPVGLAIVSFLSALGLLAYKTFLYLRLGQWLRFDVRDIVVILDIPLNFTGWTGVDLIMLEVLDWSGLNSLLWTPITILVVLVLSAITLRWLVKLVW